MTTRTLRRCSMWRPISGESTWWREYPSLPGDVWEVHQLAVDLEHAGVAATVVHSDLSGVADHIDDGATVFITVDTADGSVPMRVVEVQWDRDILVVTRMDGSQPRSLDLDLFEDQWAETANQLLIADPPTSDAEILLPTGQFVAVPVHVTIESLPPLFSGWPS